MVVVVVVVVALAAAVVVALAGLLVVTVASEVVAEGLVFHRLPLERAGPMAWTERCLRYLVLSQGIKGRGTPPMVTVVRGSLLFGG